METKNTSILQESREKEIPNIIEKYKNLGETILKQVGTDMPKFKDIELKDGEDSIKKITAEEQLYSFMLMREKAVDHVDRLYNKVNVLEIELYNPELFKALQNKENAPASNVETSPKNPVKTRVRKLDKQ